MEPGTPVRLPDGRIGYYQRSERPGEALVTVTETVVVRTKDLKPLKE